MCTGGGWLAPPRLTRSGAIALDVYTLAVLSEHRVRATGWAQEAGITIEPSGYILTFDPSGMESIRPDSLGQAFGRLSRRLGLEGLTLHSLRHFSASTLMASGRDVRTIAGRLGHADASTTVRLYAHGVGGKDQDAADLLGAALSRAQPAAACPGEQTG